MGNEIGKLIERNVTDPNLVAEAVNFTQIPPLIAQENKVLSVKRCITYKLLQDK